MLGVLEVIVQENVKHENSEYPGPINTIRLPLNRLKLHHK